MKKVLTISAILVIPAIIAFSIAPTGDFTPEPIPESVQPPGNVAKGYEYLTTGDFIKSGIPYKYYKAIYPKSLNYLERTGKNARLGHGYNLVKQNGVEMAVPTCLQCHAQVFEGKLVMGLGNASIDFSQPGLTKYSKTALKMMRMTAPRKYKASRAFYKSVIASFPHMKTEVRGVNTADKLALILVAHRDPQTLKWSDKELLEIPKEVIPTDVPAWWLMKKKNAMFYNGFARGDFRRYLMMSNLLAVKDTAEAREVIGHFGDVLAYIRSIEPPKYPKEIDAHKAEQGKLVFNENCSRCHGTYGYGEYYPNLLIPSAIIQTDSALYAGIRENKVFADWFNKSWFTQGDNPAYLHMFDGYIAPPLDGVWVTAPYLHNGSVPTLEALLNSKLRPKYWSRDFNKQEYDYTAIGWKHNTHLEPIAKKTYNTTLPGYGNYGHYFGDMLNNEERSAVIEYLKTL